MHVRSIAAVTTSCLLALLLVAPPAHAHANSNATQRASVEAPDLTAPFGDATDLGDGLVDISEAHLETLLSAADEADGAPIAINSESNPALGFIHNPEPEYDAQLFELIEPVLSAHPEVTLHSVDLVATELERMIGFHKDQKTAQGEQIAVLGANARVLELKLKALTAARRAVDSYRANPSDSRFTEAQAALLAADVMAEPLIAVPKFTPSFWDLVTGKSVSAARDAAINQARSAAGRTMEDLTAHHRRFSYELWGTTTAIQGLLDQQWAEDRMIAKLVQELEKARTEVVGSMRSTPVALGTSQWNSGAVSGALDLTDVPDGGHHLILDFADAGITIVASVTVSRDAGAAWAWGLGGVALAAVLTLGGVVLWRRRHRASQV